MNRTTYWSMSGSGLPGETTTSSSSSAIAAARASSLGFGDAGEVFCRWLRGRVADASLSVTNTVV